MNDIRAAVTTPAGSRITRRAALSGAAGLVVTAFAGLVAAQDRTRTIPQPNRPGREAFMERAPSRCAASRWSGAISPTAR